jgi:hypothetical protein
MSLARFNPPTINDDISDFSDVAQDMRRMREKTTNVTFPRKRCACQSQISTTTYLRWPFQLERTQTTMHNPSCKYRAIERAVSSLQMRFNLCSLMLGQKAHIGLALSRGANGTTMSKVVLECTRIVSKTSPAFELLDRLLCPGEYAPPEYKELHKEVLFLPAKEAARYDRWEEMECIRLFKTAAIDLERLFDSGKASPYDRLPNGMTLLHVSRSTEVMYGENL